MPSSRRTRTEAGGPRRTARQDSSHPVASPRALRPRVLIGLALGLAALVSLAVWQFRKPAPDPALQHAALGRALHALGKFEESEKELREAVRLMAARKHPNAADTLVFLGNALAERGRTNDAAECFRQALAARPSHPDAHAALAAVLAKSGDVKQATEHNLQALAANPSNVTAHVNLGVALAGEGKFEEAVSHYQKALAIDPDLPSTRINLAIALTVLGRVEEAQAEYEKAANSVNAHAAKLVQEGRTNEAIVRYSEAVRLIPNNAEAHCSLGKLYLEQGRIADARAQFFEVLRIKPDHAEANSRLRQLPVP